MNNPRHYYLPVLHESKNVRAGGRGECAVCVKIRH